MERSAGEGVSFAEAGLQLVFVNLLRTSAQDEAVSSVRYLSLGDKDGPVGAEGEVVIFAKLLPSSAPTRRISSAAEGASSPAQSSTDPVGKSVLLVVGTASGRTYFWDVDPAADAVAKVCTAEHSSSCAAPPSAAHQIAFLEPFAARAEAHETAGAPLAVAATAAFSHPAYTVVSLAVNFRFI